MREEFSQTDRSNRNSLTYLMFAKQIDEREADIEMAEIAFREKKQSPYFRRIKRRTGSSLEKL